MSEEPTIIIGGDVVGKHHAKPNRTRQRIKEGKGYRDLSTVMVCPTRGVIPARVVQAMMDMVPLMNQPFVRVFIEKMEVAAAYNAAVDLILNHPALSNFKYMLTFEEDNMPPPDGLHRLFESIDGAIAEQIKVQLDPRLRGARSAKPPTPEDAKVSRGKEAGRRRQRPDVRHDV